jgi:serine/threonine protein kinase
MFGEVSYGKPIDLWATGLIMYELITGKHALWSKGEDKPTYKEKMKGFKGLKMDDTKISRYAIFLNFNRLAINLLEKLCHPKPSSRYKVD